MRITVLVSLLFALAACGKQNDNGAPSAPTGSTVSIVSITPSISQQLRFGEKVKLNVKAAYTLTSESGTLALVVQDSNNTPLAQTINVVLKGSGTEEFAVEFTVPETKAVQVFVPLSAQDQGSTATVSSRAYKVTSK